MNAPEPAELGGIRNFGWVVPGQLARGEQPPLDAATFIALLGQGIGSVVSLRQDRERAVTLTGRLVPEYAVEEERTHCERFDLSFHHLACTDFQALEPDDVARALRTIDAEVESGRAVFVHCLAGAGRTSLISAAWLMSRGGRGNHAARMHARFLEELDARLNIPLAERDGYRQRVGRGHSWWGLLQIARALGDPVTVSFDLPTPERPPYADSWEAWYARELLPWRQPGR